MNTASIMHDLTGFQRDLLYDVAGLGEPHGWAIKEGLEKVYEKEIHHGRLQPNLDTIVDKGLIDKGELDQRTNYYSITRRGRREIEAGRKWESEYLGQLNHYLRKPWPIVVPEAFPHFGFQARKVELACGSAQEIENAWKIPMDIGVFSLVTLSGCSRNNEGEYPDLSER